MAKAAEVAKEWLCMAKAAEVAKEWLCMVKMKGILWTLKKGMKSGYWV
jgi:hypothetical protein